MKTLTLCFEEKKIRTFHLKQGEGLSIGRKGTNDVVIENLAVSGQHARIDWNGEGFLLTDLESKNGSFVNERMVSAQLLENGDVITIGKHTLVFEEGTAEADGAAAPLDLEQTMVMDTEKYKAMLSKNPSASPGQSGQGSGPAGVLSFISGGSGDHELKKKLVRIGKDPASDIVVKGLLVGKTAATISKRPDGYYLGYVGGLAKPRVNGEKIGASVKLKEYDEITIGPARLQFRVKG